jgi:TFIIF-interacting CTD phosphatase-like protein
MGARSSRAVLQDAMAIINKLDTKGYFSHHLFRVHKKSAEGELVKDLSVLNRDLSKVIVLDDNGTNLKAQPDNWLRIKPFQGDPNDRSLLTMIPLLQALANSSTADVRPVLKRYQVVEDAGEAFVRMKEQMEANRRAAAVAPPSAAPAAATPKRGWLW